MARNPRVHIIGDWDGAGVKRAQQDLGMFQRQAAGFSGAFTKSMMGVGAALGGAFAVGAVVGKTVDFLKEAAGAAIEDEKSMVSLAKAMDNAGMSLSIPAAEDGIKRLMLMTGIADDQLRPSLQKLIQTTGSLETAQKALSLAVDVSAGTSRSLEQVTTALARAYSGQTAGLSRLGAGLDSALLKSKDMDAITAALSDKFSGQAAAAAETFGGRMQRLATAADEAKESIGYALLGAIDDTTKALGADTGGMTGVLTLAGDVIATLVTGVGVLTTELAKLAHEQGANADSGQAMGDNLSQFVSVLQTAGAYIPVFGPLVSSVTQAGVAVWDLGTNSTQAKDQVSALRESVGGFDVAAAKAAVAGRTMTNMVVDQDQALTDLNDTLKEYLGVISYSQAMDDFRKRLADLDVTLKGNARTFKGTSDAAKENRDELRQALEDNVKNTQAWQEKTGASAEEAERHLRRKFKDIVAAFVDAGFTEAEIRKFLGPRDMWVNPAKTRVQEMADAAKRGAKGLGYGVGEDFSTGIVQGMVSKQTLLNISARQQVKAAEQAARDAAESNSPSRLFARVGSDLTEGLVVGMKSGESKAAKAGMGIVQAASNAAKQMVADAKSNAGSALGAMQGLSDSIVSSVLGNVGFGNLTKEVKDALGNTTQVALTPQELMQTLFGSIAQQGNAVQAVAQNIGDKLPPELLNMVLSLPPDTAVALADYLGANPDQLERLAYNYDTLGHMTESLLGAPMGAAWATVGTQSAKEMLAAARELIKDRKDSFTAWVANQLGVSIPVAVTFTGGSVPARAMGGPVSAGGTYLVGERGPELFTPSSAGSITPNSALSGGNTYTINVTAPASVDRRRMGQELVEMIREFENSSGAVWSAA